MKVLHVAETVKGGVATIINQIVNNSRVGKHYVLVPKNQDKEIEYNTITFFRSGRNINSFLNLLAVFIKSIFKLKPDVIHIHSTFAGVICRLALILVYPFHRPKVIYCPHAFAFMMGNSSIKKLFYSWVEIFLSVVTKKIICTSVYEKKLAESYGIKDSKLIVIYNSVCQPTDVEIINKESDSELNLIFIGRFDYQKGFDMVLAISEDESINVKITAVGDFVNERREISRGRNINFTGWISKNEMGKYLVAADALIMPSRWESFGLVAVEAQSYRIPIIASNNTAIPEVVHNGKTGYLFETDNYSQLRSLLSSINKKKLKAMADDCYKNYYNNFRTEVMVDNIDSLYIESEKWK